MSGALKRRKRSNGDVYEYYESKTTRMKRPNRHRGMTSAVYTVKTESKTGKNGQPKRRQRLRYMMANRRPKSEEFEPFDHVASEVDDLANDEYFYEQLEKNKPTTESSADVEDVHLIQPHVNRDVVFIQGTNKKRRGKQRQQTTRFNYKSPQVASGNEDMYNDYGEMVEMPDADVEMHETFEQNTKEGNMKHPIGGRLNRPFNHPVKPSNHPVMHSSGGRQQHHIPTQQTTQKPKCRKRRPTNTFVRPSFNQNKRTPNNGSKQIAGNSSVRKPKFDQIKVTKKLNNADELHAEIDKIFLKKNANYDKRGHQNSHWELRIVPIDYKTHEEYGNI